MHVLASAYDVLTTDMVLQAEYLPLLAHAELPQPEPYDVLTTDMVLQAEYLPLLAHAELPQPEPVFEPRAVHAELPTSHSIAGAELETSQQQPNPLHRISV